MMMMMNGIHTRFWVPVDPKPFDMQFLRIFIHVKNPLFFALNHQTTIRVNLR